MSNNNENNKNNTYHYEVGENSDNIFIFSYIFDFFFYNI